MRDNIYGIQKVEPTEVRNNKQIASATGTSALQGVQAGSKYGKAGAIAGGVLYGGAALLGQKGAQQDEKKMRLNDESYNKFIDNLEGRTMRNDRYVMGQAKNGRGSGSSPDKSVELEGGPGGGEIYGTPKYRDGKLYAFHIKGDTAGEPSHEEGGVDIPTTRSKKSNSKYDSINLEKDVIIDTQKDPEYNAKVKKLISSANMGNSIDAKKLDKIIKALPTEEDYTDMKAEDGLNNTDAKTFLKNNYKSLGISKYKINKMTPESAKAYLETRKNEAFIKENYKSPIEEVTEGVEGIDDFSNVEAPEEKTLHEVVQDIRQSNGEKNPSKSEWNALLDKGLKDTGYSKKDVYNYMKSTGFDVGSDYTPDFFGKLSTEAANSIWKYTPEQAARPENTVLPDFTKDEIISNDNKVSTDTPITESNLPPSTQSFIIQSNAENNPNYVNPLKYASVYNNLQAANSPIDRVERNYFIPDTLEYQDRSDSLREANLENRNFMSRASQNTTNRTGFTGQQRQIGAGYMRQAETINEREAARADQIDQYNTTAMNEARRYNIDKADMYNSQDDQAEAVRRGYRDIAYSEISQLAQLNEQAKYMRNRNAKQDAMQKATLPLIGTSDMNAEQRPDGSLEVKHRGNQQIDSKIERGYSDYEDRGFQGYSGKRYKHRNTRYRS